MDESRMLGLPLAPNGETMVLYHALGDDPYRKLGKIAKSGHLFSQGAKVNDRVRLWQHYAAHHSWCLSFAVTAYKGQFPATAGLRVSGTVTFSNSYNESTNWFTDRPASSWNKGVTTRWEVSPALHAELKEGNLGGVAFWSNRQLGGRVNYAMTQPLPFSALREVIITDGAWDEREVAHLPKKFGEVQISRST